MINCFTSAFFIGLLISIPVVILLLQLGIDILFNDLEFVHTLSQHNHTALLNGYEKGTKPYWYLATPYTMEQYFIYLHFSNLVNHNTLYSILPPDAPTLHPLIPTSLLPPTPTLTHPVLPKPWPVTPKTDRVAGSFLEFDMEDRA